MLRNIIFGAIACIFTSPLAASSYNPSNTGFYIGALGGGSFLHREHSSGLDYTDVKPGYLFGAAAGYRFCYPMRLEGEFTYRTNGIDIKTIDPESGGFTLRANGARVSVYTYMANLYFEGRFNCNIRPYFGVGAGYANINSKQEISSPRLVTSENRTCYQAIGGVGFPIWCKTELGMEYRYLYAQNCSQHHAIVATLRYFFR